LLQNGAAFLEQLAPSYRAEAYWADSDVTDAAVLDSLGLGKNQLIPGCPPLAVSNGMGS